MEVTIGMILISVLAIALVLWSDRLPKVESADPRKCKGYKPPL